MSLSIGEPDVELSRVLSTCHCSPTFSGMILSSLHRQHRLISLIIMSSKPKTKPPAFSLPFSARP